MPIRSTSRARSSAICRQAAKSAGLIDHPVLVRAGSLEQWRKVAEA